MAKAKATPKHNPGKFWTHLAQVEKHLKLALAEHAKLPETGFVLEIKRRLECAEGDIDEAFGTYIRDLRPTLPGYIEVQDVGEIAEDEG